MTGPGARLRVITFNVLAYDVADPEKRRRSGPYGPSLDVADARLMLNRPIDGVWPSDHYGLLVDLRAPSHPPGSRA